MADHIGVAEALLQRHRLYLQRLTVVRIANRSFFLVLVGLSLYSSDATRNTHLVILAAGVLIALFWLLEQRSLGARVRALEDALARTTRSGIVEDEYIRLRYVSGPDRVLDLMLEFEALLWMALLGSIERLLGT